MAKPKHVSDALHVITAALHSRLEAGADARGILHVFPEDLEVEVSIRVRRRVPLAEQRDYRDRAIALLAAEPWRDRCPRDVPNRGYWSATKTKRCSHKVAVVIVRRASELKDGKVVDVERFHFVCHHHEDVNEPDVIAVVRLDQGALRTMRAKRDREREEQFRRERELERAKGSP